jgi:hypothetical protein
MFAAPDVGLDHSVPRLSDPLEHRGPFIDVKALFVSVLPELIERTEPDPPRVQELVDVFSFEVPKYFRWSHDGPNRTSPFSNSPGTHKFRISRGLAYRARVSPDSTCHGVHVDVISDKLQVSSARTAQPEYI